VLGYFQNFEQSDGTSELLKKMLEEGYRLALSGDLSKENLALLDNAVNTVILDVTRYTPEELEKRVAELRKYRMTITAACVDTHDDLVLQGPRVYFYQATFSSAGCADENIPVNRMNMVRQAVELHAPGFKCGSGKLVSQDVASVTKFCNTPTRRCGAPRKSILRACRSPYRTGDDTHLVEPRCCCHRWNSFASYDVRWALGCVPIAG
jgi:hypothetical protein